MNIIKFVNELDCGIVEEVIFVNANLIVRGLEKIVDRMV